MEERNEQWRSEKWRVAVLAGGTSAEREVSLASGAAVEQALKQAGHLPQIFDPASVKLEDVPWHDYSACFLALHGGAGEDGRVQAVLDQWQIPYTGSGPEASRLAMSKAAAKQCFQAADVLTPAGFTLPALCASDELEAAAWAVGFPLVVKPESQGSSLGVTKVERMADLPQAFAAACRWDERVMLESFIAGRELTVTLLDDRPLPVLEIVSPRAIFDYQAKYASADTEYQFPHDIWPATLRRIQNEAVIAAQSLGVRSLSRVDVLLDENNRAWVLEVNTIPGLTPRSLAPKAAQRAGMNLAALCDEMLRRVLVPAWC